MSRRHGKFHKKRRDLLPYLPAPPPPLPPPATRKHRPNTYKWTVLSLATGKNPRTIEHEEALHGFKYLHQAYTYATIRLSESLHKVTYFDHFLNREVNFFPNIGHEPKLEEENISRTHLTPLP